MSNESNSQQEEARLLALVNETEDFVPPSEADEIAVASASMAPKSTLK